MAYLHWNETTLTDFSEKNIESLYDAGYLFTRIGKGIMQQTRSVRINLSEFELSSENRRILKKTEDVEGPESAQPPYKTYTWEIGKLGKDFYDTKFGKGVFSANKIKEIITEESKSNFNTLFIYKNPSGVFGYCIAYVSSALTHYSYPFYNLTTAPKDAGLGMMLRAIVAAKESGQKYIYLGSLQRPGDVYKLQFKGIEWFDGTTWQTETESVKEILKNAK